MSLGDFHGPDSAWLWTMVQSVIYLMTLFVVYRQLRKQAQANTMAVVHVLDARWCSEEMLAARAKACAAYSSAERSINRAEGDVLGFFEDVSLYLKRDVLDVELIWEKYSYWLEHYWVMYEAHIEDYRKATADASWYTGVEALIGQLAKHSRKRKAPLRARAADAISRFRDGEIGRPVGTTGTVVNEKT